MGSVPTSPAPDYGKANQDAVYSDFATLPDRTKIEQASRFGDVTTYTDPRNGEVKTADFRGGFDKDAFFKAHPDAYKGYLEEQQANGYDRGDGTMLKARDPQTFAEQWLQWSGKDPTEMDQYRRPGGDLAYAQQSADLAVNTNERLQRGQLDLRQEMVTDPETGKPVTRGEMNALQTAREIRAADPAAYQARQDLTNRVMGDLNTPTPQISADTNFGRLADKTAGLDVPQNDTRFGQLYNDAYSRIQRNQSQPQDQTLGNLQNEAAQTLQVRDRSGIDPALMAYAGEANRLTQVQNRGMDPQLMRLQREADQLTRVKNDPRLGQIYGDAASQDSSRLNSLADEADQRLTGDVSDSSTAALNKGLQQASDEYALGGKLDDATRSEVEQQVRQGQAARGNILGNAATFTEAMELGKAGEARKAQRLQQLLNVQNQAFGQNSQLRDQQRQAMDQRFSTLASLDNQGFDRTMSRDQVLAALQQQETGQRSSAVDQRLNSLGNLQGQNFTQQQTLDNGRRQDVNTRLAALGDVQGKFTDNSRYADSARLADASARFGTLSALQGQKFAQDQTQNQNDLQNFGFLSGLVSADVAQNQTRYQNEMGQIGTEAQLRGQQTSEDRATRAENYGRDQQKLANASSFILGQPITNQFGSLQAAQNGSVGFNQVGYKGGQTVADPQAATSQIFGTQADLYKQSRQLQQDSNNQWMQLAGSAAGAAAGMMM